MSVTVDSQHRVRLPGLVKPGQEYQTETPKPGVIVLRLQQAVEGEVGAALVADTWEKLGPAPEVDFHAI